MSELFVKHTSESFEHRDITVEERNLLAMALANIGEYIHDNSPQYILIEDPRNEEDYDSWQYGMEVLPHDHIWSKTSIDINSSEVE